MLPAVDNPPSTTAPPAPADGELYVAGSNDSAQLGIRQQENVLDPTRVQGLESRQVEQVRMIGSYVVAALCYWRVLRGDLPPTCVVHSNTGACCLGCRWRAARCTPWRS